MESALTRSLINAGLRRTASADPLADAKAAAEAASAAISCAINANHADKREAMIAEAAGHAQSAVHFLGAARLRAERS